MEDGELSYAIVRINSGAKCFQDMQFFRWPPSQYEGGVERIGVADDRQIFTARKVTDTSRGHYWDCRCAGAGERGAYGNGSIFAFGADCVEMLTPLCLTEDAARAALAKARGEQEVGDE